MRTRQVLVQSLGYLLPYCFGSCDLKLGAVAIGVASAPAQQQVDDMLQELREKASLSALESILLRFATMLSPAASAPTGCAWQLRAPKGWEIRTAFIYPGGCVSEHFVADPVS